MSNKSDNLDFSGLFKLDVLVQLEISKYNFYELGLKKFLALSCDKELLFLFINPQGERSDNRYDWDFVDNPVYCMCFEPSGTWVLVVSDQKVLLVPFLPLFTPQSTFDCKWSLKGVTVLPLGVLSLPNTVVWWLTKESDNILIIGSQTGSITFYSLESQTIVGETKVSDEIIDLQICFDDSLDLLTLLITGTKSQSWKLILEHRSFSYNWLQQYRSAPDRDKKEGFMSYIKQLSKDKITLFSQGSSKEKKPQTVEYVLKPVEYLPSFRKGSNNWALTEQYVDGRHFLTAFEVNEGTMILESPEQEVAFRTFRPVIKKDGGYVQGLWSSRLIYLLRNNELEVHSSAFSVMQGDGVGSKEHTLMWNVEVIGTVLRAYVLSKREIAAPTGNWREPTFLCDLQMPRFNLEQCLIVTTNGVFLLDTVSCGSEWLVSQVCAGRGGAERAAAALSAPTAPLLRAAADLLLSRGKTPPAHYLYSLSQSPPDGWVARLGVFARLQELSMYKQSPGSDGALGDTAVTLILLALLLKVANNSDETFDTSVKLTNLSTQQMEELCAISASVGLWNLVPIFSIHRGLPSLLLSALEMRGNLCRGALNCVLRQRSVVSALLDTDSEWFYDYVSKNCRKFDERILKCLCLWLCPLQDQLSPVMRDLKQDIKTVYTSRITKLISAFMQVVSVLELRNPNTDINPELPEVKEPWSMPCAPKRVVSCGLAHWAVADDYNAKVMLANTPVNTELVGRVLSVACGRHHTLVLTENGLYSAGDNTYGQLGLGAAWPGAIGDNASPNGTLSHVPFDWPSSIETISAGHYHSAAIDVGGRLYTWGWGVHGQLGLGTTDDEWLPKIVTKLQGRKITSVGCGACHTAALTMNGEVWVWGAGAFGQLGNGGREKNGLPTIVTLPDTAVAIAVGYMHNLALTRSNKLYTWGGSPQNIRAASARRTAASDAPPDAHLLPTVVDTCNVTARIVHIAAGWHHSCLITNTGTLYSWGLNFDGQLGSGDRKQVPIPTEVQINRATTVEADQVNTEVKDNPRSETKSLVACGGDFTIYIDDEGRIYSSGNTHLEVVSRDLNKIANSIIMMKTTKRVIKIPASRTNNKSLCFSQIDRLDVMFPFEIENTSRQPIHSHFSPLLSIKDFKRKTWSDEILVSLLPWINEDCLKLNEHLAAKYMFHNKKYSECLNLLLQSLQKTKPDDSLYLAHTELCENESNSAKKRVELKIQISNVMSKRIKDISLTILNEQAYPNIDVDMFKNLPCCCDEMTYIPIKTQTSTVSISERNLSIQAAEMVDKCISIFPMEADLWDTCFRLAKDFYLENDLCVEDLETVLRKYMELNATNMANAVMFSKDCVQYNKMLSPKFYLNMCNEIMDAIS